MDSSEDILEDRELNNEYVERIYSWENWLIDSLIFSLINYQ